MITAGRAARQHRARSSLLRVSNAVLVVLAFCAGLAVNRLGHHVFSGSSTKSNAPTVVDDTFKSSALRGVYGGIPRLVRKPRSEEIVEARPPADIGTTPLPTFVQKVVVAEDKKDEIVPRSQTSSRTTPSIHRLVTGQVTTAVPTLPQAPRASSRTVAPGPVVIDAFPFHHEYDMLELRLHELRDVADCHILVESRYSQFGEVKPLYFEQSKNSSPDRFAAYRDKIVHIVVEDKPEGVGCELGWKHEWHVRDAILRGLDSDEIKNCGAMSSRELRDDDILMISDADEVPRGTVVKKLKAKWPVGLTGAVRFEMRWSFYGFYWLNPHHSQVSHAQSVAAYRKMRQTQANGGKYRHEPDIRESNAGWHCSWCFPTEEYLDKLRAALCGDGIRWGDYEWSLDALRYLRKHGIWYGATQPFDQPPVNPSDPNIAPELAKIEGTSGRFGYLLAPEKENLPRPVMPYCECAKPSPREANARNRKFPDLQRLQSAWCTGCRSV